MKNRAIAALSAAAIACTIFVLSACAAEMDEDKTSVDAVESVEIMPCDFHIASATLIDSNIGLEMSKMLNEENGKYVNLNVENNGSNSVVAAINGQNSRTLKPGESGHISLEVTQGFLGLDREYEFTVVAGTNGGAISIHYEIAQQDTQ